VFPIEFVYNFCCLLFIVHFFFLFSVLDEALSKAKSEEIIIPFGVGIAGTVAQTKETINIKEAYKDSRFNCEIDQKTGYKTNAIVSMPICNYEGDVIGVAQIINKTNGE
jgi:cGMP-specific 3',5'-cyclic phosphodiesterase, invertebrate